MTKPKSVAVPTVTKEEFLDAIRNGVHDAIWQMITNKTDCLCADFFDKVKEGVEAGVAAAYQIDSRFEGA